MKKTLSRLICVLLVAVMVCGMIPVVSADTSVAAPDGKTPETAYIMYVNPKNSSKNDRVTCNITPCNKDGHTLTVKYTPVFNGVEQKETTTGTYVKYDTSTQEFIAQRATFDSSNRPGYVKAVISCQVPASKGSSTKVNCVEFKSVTKYFVVYSEASSVTLKDSDGKTLSGSLNVSSSKATRVYVETSPKTINPENIRAKITNTSVAHLLSDTPTYDSQKEMYYFEVKAWSGSASTDLTVYADDAEKTIDIITNSAVVLTLKKGNETVAKSNDDGDSYIDAKKDAEFTLTATPDSALGDKKDVEWSVDNTNVVRLQSKSSSAGSASFKVVGYGTATITASLNGVAAELEIRVLNDITTIDIVYVKEDDSENGKNIDRKEMRVNDTFATKVDVTPYKYQAEAASSTIWSISDRDVVDFVEAKVDPDTETVKAATVSFMAKQAGTATITATLGSKTDKFTVKVEKIAESIEIIDIPTTSMKATVRSGSRTEIIERMNNNTLYNSIPGTYKEGKISYSIQVPVTWYDAEISADKKTAVVRGNVITTDGENNFTYASTCPKTITANVTLTNDAIVSKLSVTGDKTTAVAGNVINLTANATVEPSDAKVTYQWYANGKAISGATAATAKYTIPQASSDSSTQYDFTCVVTASKAGTSNSAESTPFTVTVSRDYTVSISVNDSNATYTVGEKPKATATLYYKGSTVSNVSFSWNLLDNSKGNTLDSNYATISGSGSSATVTTKGADSASGDKYVIQASVTYTNGYTYTGTQTITVKPATAKDVKMSVGTGGNIKGSTITSAVTTAVNNSDVTTSYITFGTPTGGSLYTSSNAKTALGTSTACYLSGSSGQLLNNVYFVPKSSTSSCSVTYTAYNAKGGAIATGKVNFDTSETSGTNIYSKGSDFEDAGVVDDLSSANANASYVTFGDVKGGTLYYNYKSFTSKTDVDSGDKFYFSGSNKLLGDVYFLPAADTYTATIEYTLYSSSGSSLASDKITFTTVKQTSSRTFTDVTASNDGAWASNAIDFMAANSIVGGTGNNKFSPSDNMTRAQLVTVLYRAEGQPSVTGLVNPFTDVSASQYYYKAVLWAYSKGIVTGNTATTFNPEGNISRQDIAVILYRYAGNPTATGSVTSFTDNAKIDAYALTAMKWAVGSGIIGGSNNKLTPTGQASRAQVAAMLHRFFTK